MAEGADAAAWNRTAALWSLIANTNRSADTPAYSPKHIHPYYPDTLPQQTSGESGRLELTADNLDLFAQAYVKANAKCQ